MRNASGIKELIMPDLIIFPLASILARAHMHKHRLTNLVGDRDIMYVRNVFGIQELILVDLVIFLRRSLIPLFPLFWTYKIGRYRNQVTEVNETFIKNQRT